MTKLKRLSKYRRLRKYWPDCPERVGYHRCRRLNLHAGPHRSELYSWGQVKSLWVRLRGMVGR